MPVSVISDFEDFGDENLLNPEQKQALQEHVQAIALKDFAGRNVILCKQN
ncbi:hypothetical protein [Nostoc sp.]